MHVICQALLIFFCLTAPLTAQTPEAAFHLWKALLKGEGTFHDYAAFMQAHPHWPRGIAMRKQAEAALKNINKEAADFFMNHPPLTDEGYVAYARYLKKQNNLAKLEALVKKCWRECEGSSSTLMQLAHEFGSYLTEDDHITRVDFFFNQGNIPAVENLLSAFPATVQRIIRTRIQLHQNNLKELDETELKSHANQGIVLDYLRYLRKAKRNEEARALLSEPHTHEALYPEAWWAERNILARRYIESGEYAKALSVIEGHKLKQGESFANAQWLAGWVCLTFLGKEADAFTLFEALYHNVKSPISLARAAFWCGEACIKRGDKTKADTWYKLAETHDNAYYGQLAHSQRLQNGAIVTLKPIGFYNAKPSAATIKTFNARELVRVIKSIPKKEEREFVEPFFMQLCEDVSKPEEMALLIQLANQIGGKPLAAKTTRDLSKKTLFFTPESLPLLPEKIIRLVYDNQAKLQPYLIYLAHAIIWRESAFDPNALSHAGAQGLMQLMPTTAAKEVPYVPNVLGVKVPPTQSLYNPEKNMLLGITHLARLLEKYDGSLVLTIAAYNAGAAAVEEWIKQFGDPRQPQTNIINWIELIPYGETRNYVQRVMEKFMPYLYRLKHNSPKAYDMRQFLQLPLH
jgi:soluble lytic murein transglycosylase